MTNSNRGPSPSRPKKRSSANAEVHDEQPSAPAKGSGVQAAPQSWDLEHWPTHVYPHEKGRARYLIRMHKIELVAAGALARIGREFVIMGQAYTKWLQKQTTRAAVYDIAPNRVRREADEQKPVS